MGVSLASRRIRLTRVLHPDDRRHRPYWKRLSRWAEAHTLNDAMRVSHPWSGNFIAVNQTDWKNLNRALDELRAFDQKERLT